MTSSPPWRWWLLIAVLVVVALGSLGAVATVVTGRGAGDGVGEKVESLKDDEVPVSPEVRDREQLLAASRDFATRFNTYDESMLDESGHLADYAAVEELMTPKFGGVFADNVGYAEETVTQLGVASVGTVYAVGVASQDEDSAEVLVAGTVELSTPAPTRGPRGGGDDQAQGEDAERISTGPQRFRYQLSLVKVDGTWLVDDVDDVDDGLPPFSQPSIPETDPGQVPPTVPPTSGPPDPTTDPTGEGGR